MEREFEYYNKNIDEFDARNVFEFDMLKELNRRNNINNKSNKKYAVKQFELLKETKKPKISFN